MIMVASHVMGSELLLHNAVSNYQMYAKHLIFSASSLIDRDEELHML
jgi:hypothetical protein